jgi:purine-binding chemotaxis protein CheW
MTEREDVLTVLPGFPADFGCSLAGLDALAELEASPVLAGEVLHLPDDFAVSKHLSTFFGADLALEAPGLKGLPQPAPKNAGAAPRLSPGAPDTELALRPTGQAAPSVTAALAPLQELSVTRAAVPASLEAATAAEKYVVFLLAGVKSAVAMNCVLEVCELEHYTPVPNVPEWVLGVTNLRGDIVSIVELRALLEAEADDIPGQRNLLVTQTLAGDLTVCLVVDRVLGIANVVDSKIQKLDRVLGDGLTQYTRGFYMHGDDLLSILDLEPLLRSFELAR